MNGARGRILLTLGSGLILFWGCSANQQMGPADKRFDSLAGLRDAGVPTNVQTNGDTSKVGQLKEPVISNPPSLTDQSGFAPSLTNYHPGWKQTACLSCHSNLSQVPDHSYTDTKLCSACHGTNGVAEDLSSTKPAIAGIQSTVFDQRAIVTWTTNKPTSAKIFFGVETPDEYMNIVHADFTTQHSIELEGLTPETSYVYRVENRDEQGHVANSAEFGVLSFTTKEASANSGGGSTTPPPPSGPPASGTVFWKDDIGVVVNRVCVECHDTKKTGAEARKGAPGGINYNTFEDFQGSTTAPQISMRRVLFFETGPKKMPPSFSNQKLSETDLARLKQWLDDGAPYRKF